MLSLFILTRRFSTWNTVLSYNNIFQLIGSLIKALDNLIIVYSGHSLCYTPRSFLIKKMAIISWLGEYCREIKTQHSSKLMLKNITLMLKNTTLMLKSIDEIILKRTSSWISLESQTTLCVVSWLSPVIILISSFHTARPRISQQPRTGALLLQSDELDLVRRFLLIVISLFKQ